MANKTPEKKKKRGLFRFFHDVKGEFKKIAWPSKKSAMKNTLVVLGVVAIVGVSIWVIDLVLGLLMSLLFSAA